MVDRSEGLSYDIGNGYHEIDAEASRDRLDGYAVVSGLTPTPGTGLKVSIASGEALVGTDGSGNTVSVTLGSSSTVALDAADSTDPRRDVVWIDDTGTLGVTTGVAEQPLPEGATRFDTVQPEPPYPSDDVTVLAEVWVPAGATGLASADVRDRRQPAELVGGDVRVQSVTGASGTSVYDDATRTVGDGSTNADHGSISTEEVSLTDAKLSEIVGTYTADGSTQDIADIGAGSFDLSAVLVTGISQASAANWSALLVLSSSGITKLGENTTNTTSPTFSRTNQVLEISHSNSSETFNYNVVPLQVTR